MITRYESATKIADVTTSMTDVDDAINSQRPKKASTITTYAWGYQVRCERYGDVVCLTMNDADGSGTLPQSGDSSEALPVGYRPTADVATVCRYGALPIENTTKFKDNVGFLTIHSDGTCNWAFSNAPTEAQRWTWSISYTTNDAFPS